MRVSNYHSRLLMRIGAALAALVLCSTPALAGSRSTTMEVSAAVVSACTISIERTATTPRVRSTCTRGEQARVSLMTAPSLAEPLPQIALQPSLGKTKFLVVTY